MAFNVADQVLLASGLNGAFGWNPTLVAIVTAILAAALAIFGYDWVHRVFRFLLIISFPCYAIITVAILVGHAGGHAPAHPGGFVFAAFMSQFSVAAAYNITDAPYVSDYSRYMPRDTRPRSIIAAVFFGASGSAIWLIALGAWLATRLNISDGLVGLQTSGDNVAAPLGSNTAVSAVLNSLTLMLYLLVPGTALNLVDFFFVRRGHYAITDIFSPEGSTAPGLARPDRLLRGLRGRDPVHGAAAHLRPVLHRLDPEPRDQRGGLLLGRRAARLRPGIPGPVPLPGPGGRAAGHRGERAGVADHRPGNEMTEPAPRIVAGDNVGQVDATAVPRYGGEATFARLPRLQDVEQADVAIVGIPFDSGVSYRPGARFGPSHIRESSRLLRPYDPALQVPVFAAQQVADAGDLTVNPFSIDEAISAIERGARALAERARAVLTLGGDHTVALPMLRAVAARHGPVAVVHFDAHLDTWDTYFGAAYTHGTPFRRASEEGLLDRSGCLHAGIRGPLYSDADLTEDSELGFQVVAAPEVEDLGVAGLVERIADRVGDRPVYVSVDIDVLDPAHAPGTGTPEAGGLTSRELLATLRSFATLNLVGADIVEVAPAYDHAQITGIAAAHVGYEILSAFAVRKAAP